MNNPVVSEWLNLIFRWAHVVAGVMWIGHLWFFNFVNAQLAKTYDADSKKKVIPELMPRALYWFRWGAAWTWITGVLLLGIIYTMGAGFMREGSTLSNGAGTGIAFAVLFAGFLVYDLLWKSPIKANPVAGAIVSVVLLAASAGCSQPAPLTSCSGGCWGPSWPPTSGCGSGRRSARSSRP
jgi:uncharacterized membrane protein